MAELTAVGIYINYWLPDMPQWLSALLCLLLITLVNLVNVRLYGEFEFWLSIIKVAAIVGMIVLGLYLILTNPVGFPANVSNLWSYGGFFPNGLWGVALSVVAV